MGRELSRIMSIKVLTHKDIEIRDPDSVKRAISPRDMVVHLAAYVDVVGAEKEKQLAFDTNVIGARNVSSRAQTLYISSDYVFDGEKGNYNINDYTNPRTYYGLTKLLGEYEVLASGGKVLRLSFKPRPYKHPRVPTEMMFSGGYVDDMAWEIRKAIEHYDELPPVTHVGIRPISLYNLARQTRDIEPMSITEIPIPIPRDTTFDLTVWRKICGRRTWEND